MDVRRSLVSNIKFSVSNIPFLEIKSPDICLNGEGLSFFKGNEPMGKDPNNLLTPRLSLFRSIIPDLISREIFPYNDLEISDQSFPFPFNFTLIFFISPLKLFLNTSPKRLKTFFVFTYFTFTLPSKVLTPFSSMVSPTEFLTNGLMPALKSLSCKTLLFREIFPATLLKFNIFKFNCPTSKITCPLPL